MASESGSIDFMFLALRSPHYLAAASATEVLSKCMELLTYFSTATSQKIWVREAILLWWLDVV